jgi:two-component system chemotaxis sensor kinase CheA
MEVDTLSERDIDRLIFQAGLSTAQKITALAGRGVGLDVVVNAVQSLGGTMDVRSTAGQGTVFILDVPVTISRQTVLVFGVDSELYAVPTGFVEETLLVNTKNLIDVENETHLTWRGIPVPVADAGRLLGCQGLTAQWIRPYVLILRTGNQRAALLLDWLAPVQEMVIKPFDPLFQNNRLMVGAAVTGQGQVVPVLNCLEVVQRTRSLRIAKSAYVLEEGMYHAF